MNNNLMKAILSMDSYNRGYGAGVIVNGNELGNAEIVQTTLDGQTVDFDSATIVDPDTDERLDDDIGFYALAYSYGGETVISYRGTNFNIVPSPKDVFHGWSLGNGNTDSEQGRMAAQFC